VKKFANETGVHIVLCFFKEFIYKLSIVLGCTLLGCNSPTSSYVDQGRLMGYKGFLCTCR